MTHEWHMVTVTSLCLFLVCRFGCLPFNRGPEFLGDSFVWSFIYWRFVTQLQDCPCRSIRWNSVSVFHQLTVVDCTVDGGSWWRAPSLEGFQRWLPLKSPKLSYIRCQLLSETLLILPTSKTPIRNLVCHRRMSLDELFYNYSADFSPMCLRFVPFRTWWLLKVQHCIYTSGKLPFSSGLILDFCYTNE